MASLANSSKHLKNYYLYFSNFKKKKNEEKGTFLNLFYEASIPWYESQSGHYKRIKLQTSIPCEH